MQLRTTEPSDHNTLENKCIKVEFGMHVSLDIVKPDWQQELQDVIERPLKPGDGVLQ